jgi:hypothetical protein
MRHAHAAPFAEAGLLLACPPDVGTASDASKDTRRLGDEWRDWDGESPAEAHAGKRLFFALGGALLFTTGGAGVCAWYLVAPRLAQWHPRLPVVLLGAIAVLVVIFLVAQATVAATLLLHVPLPRAISALVRRLLSHIEGGVFSLGALLSIDRDRIAHSFVLVHNALVRASRQHTTPDRLLVLLPRCLTREQLKQASALGDRYGVGVAVVAGGELARQRIKEHRPAAVIGVACERDLLSGIRDVRGRLCVLGIPNTRPHGPCKDTCVDLAELQQAIEFYVLPRTAGRELVVESR